MLTLTYRYRHGFQPHKVYNVDETGLTTTQSPRHIITERGRKQVGGITSRERGDLVTLVCTINAAGGAIPPMLIFPRTNYKDWFLRVAPVGSIGAATKSGWMDEDKFVIYLEHIIRHTRCTTDHPILLILDNHASHLSLKGIDLARANGIVLLTLPPHTFHRLQPLDRTVFGSLKSHYNKACDWWMRSNPGKTMTIYEIPELANQAFIQAMTPANIIAGFRTTGIVPFNRECFIDSDFAAAEGLSLDPVGTREITPGALSGTFGANAPLRE